MSEKEIKSSKRSKDLRALAIIVVTFFLIGFEAYTLVIAYNEENSDLPQNIGNFEPNRNSLKKQDTHEKFSFAVVGDTRATRAFERLCDELRNESLSFMVILGDFVEESTRGNHDYFKFECTHEYNLPCPVFLVTGSHDVVWKERGCDLDEISVADFERMYGPRNFYFEYNGCLFVGLCILPPPFPTEESILFLKSVLSKHRDDNQRVFVFTHMPIIRSTGPVPNSFENMQDFIDIIDSYKVDYVISSHHRGYDRTKRNNTVYLATGNGRPLDEKETFYGLCHAIVLTLDHGSVSEKTILARRSTSIAHSLRYFATVDLAPFLKRHAALTIAENLLVLVLLCVSTVKFIRMKSRVHPAETGE